MQKKFRLKKNEDFKRLIETKKFIGNKTFTVYYTKNVLGYSRFGISVGKKHGNAVRRNKIKRQIRMMILELFKFSNSYDYLIMIRDDYHKQSFSENIDKLCKLSSKIEKEVQK